MELSADLLIKQLLMFKNEVRKLRESEFMPAGSPAGLQNGASAQVTAVLQQRQRNRLKNMHS